MLIVKSDDHNLRSTFFPGLEMILSDLTGDQQALGCLITTWQIVTAASSFRNFRASQLIKLNPIIVRKFKLKSEYAPVHILDYHQAQ